MNEGKTVIVFNADMPAWNGETGRIRHCFTTAMGEPAAVIALARIACDVVFHLDELREITTA